MEKKAEPVDLSILLPRILDRWRPRFTRAKVQPYFQSLVSSPHILGDPRALEQVFTNLISNAVDAMKDGGGTLAIKIINGKPDQDPPQFEITVSDTGPGIPDELRDHIFKPFISNSPEGTGLGLAITQRIITAHRGAYTLIVFQEVLCLRFHSQLYPRGIMTATVLVVDDEDNARLFVSNFLTSRGYEVIGVATLEEARII